jgi:hypothetical protein
MSKGSQMEKEKEEDLMIQEREVLWILWFFCCEKVNLRRAGGTVNVQSHMFSEASCVYLSYGWFC